MSTAAPVANSAPNVAPGSVVRVRDEDWLVTGTEATASCILIQVRGLTELVRDTEAAFYSDLDRIEVVDPRNAKIITDDTPRYRKTRLFLETTLRKTPEPATSAALTVSTGMLAEQLNYQRIAVAKALDPTNIRPRILIADAVGLGKTLEIGMILSELVARGRGDNILIVTPRHVLEQMQHEMWCRFALPFVRLDSQGIQRIRQQIPATRNPFTYFKRAIISIDTLKTPRYREHLKRRRWDAVVIDESHNLTNTGTLNNELARILAPRTDALILASATPHNGKNESFAELIRLLDPTAVSPDGEINEEAARKLIVRRHRYSPEVASEVGTDWAERAEPLNILVDASPAENAVAQELADTWLYSKTTSPSSNHLFGWTLAKAFLSSPAALRETIESRLHRIDVSGDKSASANREVSALRRLLILAEEADESVSAKFEALVDYLKDKGVGRGSDTRAVVFAERIATLKYLQDTLPKALGLPAGAIGLLHGGLSDVEQQEIVEDFKRGTSELRVLVTGDVASEGVNLHAECHLLVHYDIPWSLIRIEQRNGRIDRYGQRHTPEIATLLLQPDSEKFSGDIRVLTRLVEKEHEAHKILPDVASIMGKNSIKAEEDAIAKMLAEGRDIEETIPEPVGDFFDELLAGLQEDEDPSDLSNVVVTSNGRRLFDSDLEFLSEALGEAFGDPYEKVDWVVDYEQDVASLTPPADLRRRLTFLPQDYLKERRVADSLRLATSPATGKRSLLSARQSDETNWPAAHFLGPLHPVLDWASDRALASMAQNEVLAIRGDVESPEFLLLGTITNQRGQLLNRTFMAVSDGFAHPIRDIGEYLESIGLTSRAANPGPVDTTDLGSLVGPAIDAAEGHLGMMYDGLANQSASLLADWLKRAEEWNAEAEGLVQRREVQDRRERVRVEQELARQMAPAQSIIRSLLVVVPREGTGGAA